MTDTASEDTRTAVDTVPASINFKLPREEYNRDFPVFARAHVSPGFDSFLIFDPVHRTVEAVTANVDDEGNIVPVGPAGGILPPIAGVDPASQETVKQLIAEAVRQGIEAGRNQAAGASATDSNVLDLPPAPPAVDAPTVDAPTVSE